ncbi:MULTISPECIES: hypothetical protein [Arthrospira]|jgi:hypothetical protein|uniref:Transposase n=1 Tax=Limnospira platensis NIES-46 TaxID=1236695 RepID=A0A5M3T9Z2_LIMPL|nr:MULTISPECIES: hypothetical protein [Arthrospira]MBD2671403.1 hypothetical protein [Arthrospira platensis FACHB-439]MBD2712372.1 hypothetical protein [Arthrospira platensis FACHB-835]MDF2212173.1 hypothetical protein [Arthrospira platensis NCB002]MDT9184584.1 hypothetical protein [Limnospira sp. PMC 289.06]MDT9296818.1 hypothetical protein [Arthrospira platensis PCC 7345]MDT9312401.1 hypothetical protein [Limnospira sp. Paracas R14]QQW27766.1 hypothetical protein AP9108_21645 [Arthrospira 
MSLCEGLTGRKATPTNSPGWRTVSHWYEENAKLALTQINQGHGEL